MPDLPDPATDLRTGPLGTGSLLLQMAWGIFFAAWNFRSLGLIAQHQAPLGPDTSMNVALVAIGLIVALMVSAKRSAAAYAAVSLATLAVAGWAVYGELVADGSEWASEAGRAMVVAINGIGILGSALALLNVARRRLGRDVAGVRGRS